LIDPTDLAQLRIARVEPPRRPGLFERAWRWLVPLVLLLLVAIGYVLLRQGPPRVRVVVVRSTAPGAPGGSAGGLTANGYVVARTKASIASKVAGRLAYLGVEEGDHVRAGQIVARLEAAEYEAALRQAQADVLQAEAGRLDAGARLTLARQDAERVSALERDSLATLQARQSADAALASAEAQLRAAEAREQAARALVGVARANLENTRIRAPFDGTVLRKDAEVGEVVAPAVTGGGLTRGAVVTMADLSALDLEVEVNEAYIAQVRRAQPAQIVLDAYPSETFPGHVRQIVPTAERDRATVLVRVAVDTADPRILSEMGGRVVFLETTEQAHAAPRPAALFVPDSAVRSRGGRDVAWVVEQGRARLRPVDAGPVSAGRREVRSGLAPGDSVVLDPPPELVEGARVRILTPR
jgi:RND family efflux transporter MFP subunit